MIGRKSLSPALLSTSPHRFSFRPKSSPTQPHQFSPSLLSPASTSKLVHCTICEVSPPLVDLHFQMKFFKIKNDFLFKKIDFKGFYIKN
jgi:hypothetical protein